MAPSAADDVGFVDEEEHKGPESWIVETPAAFLEAKWEVCGEIQASAEHGPNTFDVPDQNVSKPEGFTLCARIKRPADVDAASGRILQKGDAPNGWCFSAPSAKSGVVSFAAGPIEIEEERTETKESKTSLAPDEAEGEEKPPPPDPAEIGITRLDDGLWHHVAVVYRDGHIQAFVDGNPDGEAVLVEVASAPTCPLMLGLTEEEIEAGAALSDVQAFAEPLSNTQIAGIASRGKDLGTGISLRILPEEVAKYQAMKGSSGNSPGGADEDVDADARSLLQEALGIGSICPDSDGHFQNEVTLRLYEDLLAYAESICLTPRKTAVMVSILWATMEKMFERSKTTTRIGETSSISECFMLYKKLLVAHTFAAATAAKPISELKDAADPSAATLGVFSMPEVRLLTEFVTGSVFQHFILYQCVLVNAEDALVRHVETEIERPKPPPDLKTGKLQPKKPKPGTLQSKADKNKESNAADASLDVAAGGLKSAQGEVTEEDGKEINFDETMKGLPKGLTIDEHHSRAMETAEAQVKSSIKRHDQDLKASK
eukprot:TRINITY_DN9695_c2_g1_i1.p1 TRINITY_DN9695_c2_g1~~TRINITY_DN9695_c2_g1_i1.p1  ORF type:complete len:555 (-),score=145.90 TRINITY_DN9695_c2_g1_i1:66-1697(-)